MICTNFIIICIIFFKQKIAFYSSMTVPNPRSFALSVTRAATIRSCRPMPSSQTANCVLMPCASLSGDGGIHAAGGQPWGKSGSIRHLLSGKEGHRHRQGQIRAHVADLKGKGEGRGALIHQRQRSAFEMQRPMQMDARQPGGGVSHPAHILHGEGHAPRAGQGGDAPGGFFLPAGQQAQESLCA